MKVFGQNLLILIKGRTFTEHEHEDEAMALHQLLYNIITLEKFCRATELVDRNYITSNPGKIQKIARHLHLRPFRFLINKN